MILPATSYPAKSITSLPTPLNRVVPGAGGATVGGVSTGTVVAAGSRSSPRRCRTESSSPGRERPCRGRRATWRRPSAWSRSSLARRVRTSRPGRPSLVARRRAPRSRAGSRAVGVDGTVSASSSSSRTKVRMATTHRAPSTTATSPTRNRRGPLGAARSGLIVLRTSADSSALAAAPEPRAAPIPRADRRAARRRRPRFGHDVGTRRSGCRQYRGFDRAGRGLHEDHRARSTPRAPAPATPRTRPTPAAPAPATPTELDQPLGHRPRQHRELDQPLGRRLGQHRELDHPSDVGPGNTENSTNSCGTGSGNTDGSTNSSAPVPATPRTAPTTSEDGPGSRDCSTGRALTVRAPAARRRRVSDCVGTGGRRAPGGGRARTPSSGVCDRCPATHEIVPVAVERDRATSAVGDVSASTIVVDDHPQHIGVSGARSLNENSTGPCGRISIRHTAACDRCVRHAIPKSTPSAQATADFIGDTWLTTTMS